MDVSYEIVLVDDGSTDETTLRALQLGLSNLQILVLARNYGHQIALEAGLKATSGEFVLTIDSDGQHPVEMIPEMYRKAVMESLDVVYASRASSKQQPLSKRLPSFLYYKLIQFGTGVELVHGAADFRLTSRRVLNEVLTVPGDKALRVLIPSVGYSSATVPYHIRPRISGSSRFGLRRQCRMLSDALLEFSSIPLRFVAFTAAVVGFVALVWLAYVAAVFVDGQTVQGWTSLMAVSLGLGSLILFSLALIGEYVARLYALVKNNPRFHISKHK